MSASRTAFLAVLLLTGPAAVTWADDTPGAKSPEAPKFDAFGDPLPAGALTRFGTIRFRHDAKAAAFLDKNTIVSVGSSIRFWDPTTGRILREYRHEKMAETSDAAISASGRRAVTLNHSALRIWDIDTGNLVREFKLSNSHGPMNLEIGRPGISVSADGSRFIASMSDTDASGRRKTATVRIWGSESTPEPIVLPTEGGDVEAYAISPDAKQVVTAVPAGSGKDGKTPRLAIWDAATGNRLRIDSPDLGSIRDVRFLPNGDAFAIAGEKGIALRTIDGKEIWRHPAESTADRVFFATCEHVVISVDKPSLEYEIQVLDAKSGKRSWNWNEQIWRKPMHVTESDGKRMIVAGDHCLHVIDLTNGVEAEIGGGHTGQVHQTRVSPDGQFVVSACPIEHDLVVWDIASGRAVRRLKGDRFGRWNIAFSPNGKLIASRSYDRRVRIWDFATGKPLGNVQYLNDSVYDIQFLADNTGLGVALGSHGLEVYRLPGVERIPIPPSLESVGCQALIRDHDGRFLAISASGNKVDDTLVAGGIDIWDVFAGRVARHLDVRRSEFFRSNLSPDGRTLATRDKDGLVHLWELSTGLQRASLKERTPGMFPGHLQSLAFSPDGWTIAMVDQTERVVRLWDLSMGKPYGEISGNDEAINTVEFTPDGCRLLTGSDDTTMLAWDMTRPEWRSRRLVSQLTEKDLAIHWERLRSRSAEEAYRSKRALAGDPKNSVEYLRERLHPEEPLPIERIRAWIVDLDAAQYSIREHASRELLNHVDQAEMELRATLKSTTSAEVRMRISQIIASAENGVPEHDQLRDLRAIEVLEQIGTPEARDLLRGIANGPVVTRTSRDAAESLKRLEARSR